MYKRNYSNFFGDYHVVCLLVVHCKSVYSHPVLNFFVLFIGFLLYISWILSGSDKTTSSASNVTDKLIVLGKSLIVRFTISISSPIIVINVNDKQEYKVAPWGTPSKI